VALTFDDGPVRGRSQTKKILAILRKHKVKATFFVLGRMAKRHPDLIKAIAEQGHLLANHSWDHPKRQNYKGWVKQIKSTEKAILAAGAKPSSYYRPPHGITTKLVQRVCADLGYEIVLYTLLSSDWLRPGVKKLTRQVTRILKGGGIVVMHDGGGNRAQTIAALPGIIAGLRKRGLEPVRLDELLEGGAGRRGPCKLEKKKN
jgi:peptidoglycan/xylan/chitin deacetylase (PgdA/CDA1 family)